ncbi:MAG: hypothetical protein ACRDXE_03385 [Acidimicrobiales bacterium]
MAALAGIIGAGALSASFTILPKPPAFGASAAQLNHYGSQHHDLLLIAAWLEGIGTLLYVVFVLAIVHLAGANDRFAGKITTLAATVVLGVSLFYDVCLIALAQSSATGGAQSMTGPVAYGLFAAAEHVFLIAPSLFLPLGFVVLAADVLPPAFGYLALGFGISAEVLGLVGLFTASANNGGTGGAAINVLVGVQALWIIAAGAIVLARAWAPRSRNAP